MKIGFVTPFLTRTGGGVFTSVQCLAHALHAEDAVRVFGLEDAASAEDLAAWQSVPIEACAVRGPRAFGYAPNLSRSLREAPLDLVHAHGLWTYCSIAAQRTGKPSVVSPHGMLDAWALAHSRWKKRLAAAAFQDAHLRDAACLHALCVSEAESIRAYGLKNPICVIPNGITLPAPVTAPRPWSECIPPAAKVLLYLGRLHPKKGLANLIRAWAAASDPAWHLAIAGWDQAGHEGDLQTLAAELRADRIHFLGPQFGPAKAAAYHHADAFILPSLSEGLPMVVLEAWAHAKPVLMTDACNLPEGFIHHAALRIEADVEGIISGLRALVALPEEARSELGAHGRRLVEDRFAWPKVAADFRAVYGWIVGNGSRPDSLLTAF